MSLANRIDSLKREAYTGANRCTPCTIVNVLLAAVLSALLALRWPLAGPPVFVAALAVIYLRGYLVPGTPWFTKTYFPDWLLRVFEKEPAAPERQSRRDADDEIDLEARLTSLGVVEPCPDADDLCLAPDFEAGWHDRIERLREKDPPHLRIAAVLDVPESDLEVEHHENGGVLATVEGAPFAQWASRGAFVADVAAAVEIRERSDEWRSIEPREWGQILDGLRLFLDRCPACGGEVVMEPEVRESCCRSREVIVSSCRACGERLFESEHPA